MGLLSKLWVMFEQMNSGINTAEIETVPELNVIGWTM